MTTNTNGQFSCHNQGCKELRKQVEVLSELLKNAQTVLNDISSGLSRCKFITPSQLPSDSQPIVSLVDDGDDTQSDVDYGEDSTKSSENHCPHNDCNGKSYAHVSSLRRHFASHLACNEQCLLCGVSFTVIRDYALHFEKCKKAANPVKNKSVLKAAQNAVDRLQTETRQKLNELRESRRSVDRIDTGPETIGTKRKADFSDHPSQRRRIQTDNSTLMPGTSFAQAEATTSRPSMDYLTDTQFTFPRNPAPRPADASWNTYGTANDEGSLGNIPVPIMYDLEEGLGSLGGIQTQGIYPNVREGDAGFDAPILLMMSSPQYWNPR